MTDTLTISSGGPNADAIAKAAIAGTRLKEQEITSLTLEIDGDISITIQADGEDPMADIQGVLDGLSNRELEAITINAEMAGFESVERAVVTHAAQPRTGEPGRVGQNTVEHTVLSTIYQLTRDQDEFTSEDVKNSSPDYLGLNSIRPALYNLTEKQLLDREKFAGDGGRHLYTFTDAGEAEAERLEDWDEGVLRERTSGGGP